MTFDVLELALERLVGLTSLLLPLFEILLTRMSPPYSLYLFHSCLSGFLVMHFCRFKSLIMLIMTIINNVVVWSNCRWNSFRPHGDVLDLETSTESREPDQEELKIEGSQEVRFDGDTS